MQRLALVVALAAAALPAGIAAPAASAADACPNAAVRAQQQSEHLPDCRAYEQVSPVEKNGGDAATSAGSLSYSAHLLFARPGGGQVVYDSFAAFNDPASGYINQYRAVRSATGWISYPVTPSQGDTPNFPDLTVGVHQFSCDTCDSLLGTLPWPIDSADDNAAPDAYRVDGIHAPEWLAPGAQGFTDSNGYRVGSSHVAANAGDGSVVAISSLTVLDPALQGSLPGVEHAYIRTATGTHALAVDDNGVALSTQGSRVGGYGMGSTWARDAISRDGSRVFFSTLGGSSPGHIYVRENGQHTRRLDTPQCTSGGGTCDPDPNPGETPQFVDATSDGRLVFFTTAAQLVDEDDDQKFDLYVTNVDTGKTRRIATGVAASTVELAVPGISDDGRLVYVLSTDVLTSQPNARGELPSTDGLGGNLYLLRLTPSATVESVTYVGGGGGKQLDTWAAQGSGLDGVSANGRYAVFRTTGGFGGSGDVATTSQDFLYDAVDDVASCISCVAGPTQADVIYNEKVIGPTNDGTVLFNTSARISPRDSSPRADVYLWHDGAARLLSSGHSDVISFPVGMSNDGREAFFATSDRLAPTDNDDNQDVYVARVDGGFLAPASPAPECVVEACQGAPALAEPALSLASAGFMGAADPSPPARKAPLGKVTAKLSSARAASLAVRVTLPAAGTVIVSGTRVHAVRTVKKAKGAVTLRLRLTAGATKSLRRHGHLRLPLRVTYKPASGTSSSVSLSPTVKR